MAVAVGSLRVKGSHESDIPTPPLAQGPQGVSSTHRDDLTTTIQRRSVRHSEGQSTNNRM